MGTFIIILIVIVSIALGLIVLIQSPKGDGLAEGFQGATQMGGVKKTTDFLSKATWVLMGALFALCIASSAYFSTNVAGQDVTPIENTDGGVDVPTEEGDESAGEQ